MSFTVNSPTEAFSKISMDALASDPERVKRAREFLADAHGHGKRGTEALHEHALAMAQWSNLDGYTVALAIQIEREDEARAELIRANTCPSCGASGAFGLGMSTCVRCGAREPRQGVA